LSEVIEMLTEKAMLVRHTIKKKSFRKFDKEISREIAVQHGSDPEKSGRYNKVLIANECLSEVNSIAGKAYDHHIDNTLPWEDKGYRILPAAHYMEYMKKQREFKSEFEQAVDKFIQDYPTFVDEAKNRLNGMFKESDYPAAEQIKDHYAIEIHPTPLPDADDFRVKLNKREVDKIKKDVEQRIQVVVNEAIDGLWEQLHGSIEHLHTQLIAYKEKEVRRYFRTWIRDVEKFVNLIPKLNFTDDADLSKMCRLAKKELCKYTADELHESESARVEIEQAAKSVLDTMAGYIGGV